MTKFNGNLKIQRKMSQHPVVFVVNNITAAMTIHTAA